MPLKYIGGYKIATRIVGSVHGLLWLAFLYVLNEVRIKNMLNKREIFRFFVLSVVPFGFIPMKKSISDR
jgi:integral membrane protein